MRTLSRAVLGHALALMEHVTGHLTNHVTGMEDLTNHVTGTGTLIATYSPHWNPIYARRLDSSINLSMNA